MRAMGELDGKRFNDVLPHRHTVQTLRLQLRAPAADDTDCIRQCLPTALNHFQKSGFIIRWLITEASNSHIFIKAWLLQVGNGNS